MTSTIGVMALFGLTWIFGTFTVREASTAFQLDPVMVMMAMSDNTNPRHVKN